MLQKYIVFVLQKIVFILLIYFDSIFFNKEMYVVEKLLGCLLKLVVQFGFVFDILYIVLFYYKLCRYRNVLYVLELVKVKLV